MKLEVGMYVRTKWGINKINEYVPQSGQLYLKNDVCVKSNVIKASHNIIDLIEVGDYVNGKKVIDKWEEPFGTFAGTIFMQLDGEDTVPTIRKIESVLTKEQFESMQYEVK